VFPGTMPGKPMYHQAMLATLRELTGNAELTVHGFRSAFQ